MNKLTIFFLKLKEIRRGGFFYRIYYEIAKKIGWFYLKFLISRPSKIKLSGVINIKDNDWLDYFRRRSIPKFLINPREQSIYKDLWLKNWLRDKENLIQLANDICSHQIDVFNLEKKDFGPKINWYQDPVKNKNWPKKHWSFINIEDGKMGDIKYCWQLNRFLHFFILGRAYWVTNNEKYAREFVSQFNDWAAQNPPEMGINWSNSLEMAVRLNSFIWAIYFFINSPAVDEFFLKSFLKIIYLTSKHIEKNLNLTRFCMANDHLIGEALALFLVGLIFPEFKESKKWQKIGWQIINKEIQGQFFDDGVYFIYSPTYQRFAMSFLLSALRLAKLNKIKLPEQSLEKMGKASIFIYSLSDENGYLPNLGENDGSLLFSLDQSAYMNFSSLIENFSMLLNNSPAFGKNKFHEETFWLFGPDYLDKKENNIFTPTQIKEIFNIGGYYILKDGNRHLIFRCGENKTTGSHADNLSFVLNVGGKEIFLDNGSYSYNLEKKWRDYFKGTAAHNTVLIDNQDQMIGWRKFRWLYLTKARLFDFKNNSGEKYIEGEHYGYTRFKNSVIHNRSINLKGNEITITDIFSGRGVHQLDFYFHLPKCEYQINQKTKELTAKIPAKGWSPPMGGQATSGGKDIIRFKIFPQETKGVEIFVVSGVENPISGWHSSAYGIKIPCLTLKYSLKTNIPYQSKIILSF